MSLYLNAALINHSCSPNAAQAPLKRLAVVEEKSDHVREIRAIKAIKKGEEITTFYSFSGYRRANIAELGYTAQERMITIKRESEDLIVSAACVPATLRTRRTS